VSLIGHPAWGVALLALVIRLALIAAVPDNYSFDGFQRWAGREHLLVQGWLPATQSVIAASAVGGLLVMRVAMAIIGAAAMGAAAAVAAAWAGPVAGWLVAPLSCFGPLLAWSVVPYQESTLLLVVLGALALALRSDGALRDEGGLRGGADLAAALVGWVRYEGWPFALLWVVWRRRKTALLALTGPLLWLTLKLGVGLEGYAASPIDFDDWEGLGSRFDPMTLQASLSRFGGHLLASGGLIFWVLGSAGMALSARERWPGAGLLAATLVAQLCATLGWMVGLETATYRMQVIPGVLMGLFGVCALARLLALPSSPKTRRVVHGIAAVAAVAVAGGMIHHAHWIAARSVASVKWERVLIDEITACPDCGWLVTPRRGFGTRGRHDGCEAVQGMSSLLHGRDFWCTTWPGTPPKDGERRHAAWARGGYRIQHTARTR